MLNFLRKEKTKKSWQVSGSNLTYDKLSAYLNDIVEKGWEVYDIYNVGVHYIVVSFKG